MPRGQRSDRGIPKSRNLSSTGEATQFKGVAKRGEREREREIREMAMKGFLEVHLIGARGLKNTDTLSKSSLSLYELHVSEIKQFFPLIYQAEWIPT